MADRIEIVDPDDVFGDTVRRQAIFMWTDIVRDGSDVRYEVKKIAANGSTHIPPDITLGHLGQSSQGWCCCVSAKRQV